MSQLSAFIAGNTLGRPMNRGAQSATLDASPTTLVLNATSTSGELQVQGEILVLDPGGSTRAVYLPPVGASKGMIIRLLNSADATENLTITELAAGALATAASAEVLRQEMAVCICDGTDWYVQVQNLDT